MISQLSHLIENDSSFSNICLVISSEFGQVEWSQNVHFDARPMATLMSNSLKATLEIFPGESQRDSSVLDIESSSAQIIGFRLKTAEETLFVFALNQHKTIPGKFKFKVKKLALVMRECVSKYQTSLVAGEQDLSHYGQTLFEDISDEEIDQAFSSIGF